MGIESATNSFSDFNSASLQANQTTTRDVNGNVAYDNANYHITVGDTGTITIQNKGTGESYQISGDPHVYVNGQHAFDFWGRTSFVLDDGTKVTIQTTPYHGSATADIASTVTISNGDYGVRIGGVDDNATGDLSFQEFSGFGALLDLVTADGNTMYENPVGSGFLAVDAFGGVHQVDQNWINATDQLKGNQLAQQFVQMFGALGGLMTISLLGSFMSAIEHAGEKPGHAHLYQITLARAAAAWAFEQNAANLFARV
jgi:uncharacterized membrane protein (DUF4010 family)